MSYRTVFCLVFILLACPICTMAVDISTPASNVSYVSILYKYFRLNDYTSDNFEGQIQEVKIILRTNPHESDWDFDHLKFHKVFLTTLESEKFGWHPLFLPTTVDQILNTQGWERIRISGGITAFKPTKPNLENRRWLTQIVDYDLGMKGDIELDFPPRNKLTIMVRLSVLGEDPLWNTMKYRGEPLNKFVDKVIRKFEQKLKENYNLIDYNRDGF